MMTPDEHARWREVYGEELAKGGDEAEVLQRAGERTADLWGCRAAPDGSVVMKSHPEPELEAGQLTRGTYARQDVPVPYTLTPAGEAVASHPDTWNRELWMALDAGEQPGPEAGREARRQSDAEAWGGRGPSASYAGWLAEGRQEAGLAAEAERQAEYAAEWETEPEWDDADSAAYHARDEAGLEPEAGQ